MAVVVLEHRAEGTLVHVVRHTVSSRLTAGNVVVLENGVVGVPRPDPGVVSGRAPLEAADNVPLHQSAVRGGHDDAVAAQVLQGVAADDDTGGGQPPGAGRVVVGDRGPVVPAGREVDALPVHGPQGVALHADVVEPRLHLGAGDGEEDARRAAGVLRVVAEHVVYVEIRQPVVRAGAVVVEQNVDTAFVVGGVPRVGDLQAGDLHPLGVVEQDGVRGSGTVDHRLGPLAVCADDERMAGPPGALRSQRARTP